MARRNHPLLAFYLKKRRDARRFLNSLSFRYAANTGYLGAI